MPKIVVYTFAMGCIPPAISAEPGIDYIAFADGDVPPPWKKRRIQYDGSPYNANKYHKWHPHLWFKQYDYAIYADASLAIEKASAVVRSIGAGSPSGINLAMHREHNTPKRELARCQECLKVTSTGVICATEYLASHPSKYPVPEATSIIYDIHKLDICVLDEIWKQYLICGAYRDQLVINQAFAKFGYHPLRQQTLPGYIPMGQYRYGIPGYRYMPVTEARKASRDIRLLPATVISVPGNRTPVGIRPEYLDPLPKPALTLAGKQMSGYPTNGHHVMPSQVQQWLPAILKVLGIPEIACGRVDRRMQFGPYKDGIQLPESGSYAFYLDGNLAASGGPGLLSTPIHPVDAYHDLWWSSHLPSLTVRDGDGPDLLLIGNSMVIPLLPLLAGICHRLAYIDNRGHHNLDWLDPSEYQYRAVIFDPRDSHQEHTAAEAISVLVSR